MTGWTSYVRTSTREPFVPRVVGPLADNHPLVCGNQCPGCNYAFEGGDLVVLLPIGPGRAPDAQEKHHDGRVYNAVAVSVHAECAGIEVPASGAPSSREQP